MSNRTEFALALGQPTNGEFTMSAFGLPEPAGLGPTVPWYLIAGGLGVLLLLAGAWLRGRSRRDAPELTRG